MVTVSTLEVSCREKEEEEEKPFRETRQAFYSQVDSFTFMHDHVMLFTGDFCFVLFIIGLVHDFFSNFLVHAWFPRNVGK